MASLLPNSLFIHIPKTAGTWVRASLIKAGLNPTPAGVIHADPEELGQYLENEKMAFTFVRHPLSWHQSMWSHRMDEGWCPIKAPTWFSPKWTAFWNDFSERCSDDRFDTYLRKCMEAYPEGLVTHLYDVYTKGCGFVGKQEELPTDLFRALDLAGETYDPQSILRTDPLNVRGKAPRRLAQFTVSDSTLDRLLAVESGAINKYGYMEIPEQPKVSGMAILRSELSYRLQHLREWTIRKVLAR